MSTERLAVTEAAVEVLERLKEEHGELVFNQSGAFGNSFSLEIDLGYQFLTKSRIFTDEEYKNLEDIT